MPLIAIIIGQSVLNMPSGCGQKFTEPATSV